MERRTEMTNVKFEVHPVTKRLDPVWGQLPPIFEKHLGNLVSLAQKAKDDEEMLESFKNISAIHLLARTHHPVPPGEMHPLEGANATEYWIDYIVMAAGRDQETGKKEK